MFQRFGKNFNLDFLDNKIAEEQEKQRQAANKSTGQAPTKRAANAGANRGNPRTESVKARDGGPAGTHDGPRKNLGPVTKGLDPDDFAIGDDSTEVSRAATPRPMANEPDPVASHSSIQKTVAEGDEPSSASGKEPEAPVNAELPPAVRQKLAKLETLTTRYQDLLNNYRTAHAHVSAIASFEAKLREHTSLTSIADPDALVEFLGQKDMQKDMAMKELRRIDGEHTSTIRERDELRAKLGEAEKKAQEAFDEAAGLRREREQVRSNVKRESLGKGAAEDAPIREEKKSPDDDDFFSYEDEVSLAKESERQHEEKIAKLQSEITEQVTIVDRLQSEANGQQGKIEELQREIKDGAATLAQTKSEAKEHETYILELSTENASMRHDFEMTQLDLSAMNNKIRIKDDRLADLENQLRSTKSRLEDALAKAPKSTASSENDKRLETSKKLVETLKSQLQTAENETKELQFRNKLMEAEAESSSNIIKSLRDHEETAKTLRRELQMAETERDEAQRLAKTKKSHEAAAANLRIQLKRAEKDRDVAYQMILDCGKCSIPEREKDVADDAVTEASASTSETRSRGVSDTTDDANTQPTDISVEPSVDGNELPTIGEGKSKKKKKKSKPKKKSAEDGEAGPTESSLPSLHELIHDPTKGTEIMLRAKHADNPMLPLLLDTVEKMKEMAETRDDEAQARCNHLEELVTQERQEVKNRELLIRDRDDRIQELERRVRERSETSEGSRDNDTRIEVLQGEITSLRDEISTKDAQIERLNERLESEAALNEQIENLNEENEMLRDSIVDNGKKATDALHELRIVKDSKNELQKEFDTLQIEHDRSSKASRDAETRQAGLADALKQQALLQAAKDAADKQIEELQKQQHASGAENTARNESLAQELKNLKSDALDNSRELEATKKLAQTRYTEKEEYRKEIERIRPELKRLRDESAELKSLKVDLEKASANVRRLEAKEKDLRSEIAEYREQISSKDAEIVALKDTLKKSDERSSALEDSYETARRDLMASERTRDEAVEVREKLQSDVRRYEDELKKSRNGLEELKREIQRHSDDANALREEMQLKSAQQASAQSLMDSMRDQTSELSTQMKEARQQKESLEEELAAATRLLSERSREADTMRRLLTDMEGRADSKVKEMRERLDLAVEERDRVEEEASSLGKRRAREVEDFKVKLHDAERETARARNAREVAERRVRDLLDRETELQRKASVAQEEATEVRTALAQLRDALDEGERQALLLEKEKHDIRKALEEKELRLERLTKSSKAMAEELRALQSATTSPIRTKPPSQVSNESSRISSPVAAGGSLAGGKKDTDIDYVYLKNVLLQFLEQKDKKHQMQLIPVLGMLLHFDKQEEQKWVAAVGAK